MRPLLVTINALLSSPRMLLVEARCDWPEGRTYKGVVLPRRQTLGGGGWPKRAYIRLGDVLRDTKSFGAPSLLCPLHTHTHTHNRTALADLAVHI